MSGGIVNAPLVRSEPVDINEIIELTGLSGREFVALLGIGYTQVAYMKAGKRKGTAASRTLMLLVKEDPETIIPMLRKIAPKRWSRTRNGALHHGG